MSDADAKILGHSIARLFSEHAGGSLFIGQYTDTFDDCGGDPADIFTVSFVGRDGHKLECNRSAISNAAAALIRSEPVRLCIQCKKRKSVECYSTNSYWCNHCRGMDARKKRKRK